MTGTINNGHRADVEFGPYRGRAGVQVIDGETMVAFPANLREMKDIASGTIGGAAYAVKSIVRSESVPSMVVLTVTAVTLEA